jgi:hypothetical protein
MNLNVLGDSAWNDGNCSKNNVRFTGACAKPENPPIGLEISNRPSVRPSTCSNEASTGGLYVKFDIGDSNKNLAMHMKP